MTPRIYLEFKENSLYQEGIILETHQRTDKSYFQELRELENPVKTDRQNSFQSRLTYIKILKIIQGKILKGAHLPMTVKEIQAGYLVNSYCDNYSN